MSDKLQSLIDSVGIELWHGHLHLTVSEAIDDSLHRQGGKSPMLAVASTFFLWSLRAHWNEACLGLAKVLDQRKNTATLARMLKEAESRAGMFSTLSAGQVRRLCQELLTRVKKMDRKAAPVQERRNKVIAHLEVALDGKPNADRNERIPYDVLRDVYTEAIEMTNELAKAYKGDKAILISFDAANRCKAEFGRLYNILSAHTD